MYLCIYFEQLLSNQLCPWTQDLLYKLLDAQLFRNFPSLYGKCIPLKSVLSVNLTYHTQSTELFQVPVCASFQRFISKPEILLNIL